MRKFVFSFLLLCGSLGASAIELDGIRLEMQLFLIKCWKMARYYVTLGLNYIIPI